MLHRISVQETALLIDKGVSQNQMPESLPLLCLAALYCMHVLFSYG